MIGAEMCIISNWKTVIWVYLDSPKFRVIPCVFLTRKWVWLPDNHHLQESLSSWQTDGLQGLIQHICGQYQIERILLKWGLEGTSKCLEAARSPKLIIPSDQAWKRGTKFMQKEWDSPFGSWWTSSPFIRSMSFLPHFSSCLNPVGLSPVLKINSANG